MQAVIRYSNGAGKMTSNKPRCVLVCGGRNFAHADALWKRLDDLQWAIERHIPFREFRAAWNRWGNAAGPIRNQQMIDEGEPDLVVAFPGSSGTLDMIKRSQKAGIEVIIVGGL